MPTPTPTLASAVDGYQTTTTAAHAVGDATLAVASVAGLGSPTPINPVRISLFTPGGTTFVNFFVTGVSGTTLTITVSDGTTDAGYPAGATVGCYQSAAFLDNLNAAVGPLAAAIRTDGANLSVGAPTLDATGKVVVDVNYGQTGIKVNQTVTDALVTASGAAIAESSGFTLATTYAANTTVPNPFELIPTGVNSRATYGTSAQPAQGTIQTFTSTIDIVNCSNASSETGNYMGWVRSLVSACRMWFADFSVQGPNVVTGLLNGVTMCVNKYAPGQPTGGPAGNFWAVTKPGSGAGGEDGHNTATTYPLETGVGIVGYSTTGVGYTQAVQIGGYGSGWMPPGTARSSIGVGIAAQDCQAATITINACYSDLATQINWGGVANLHQQTNTASTGGPSLVNSLSDLEVAASGKGFVLTDTQTGARTRITLTGGALVFTALGTASTPTPTPTPTVTSWADTFTRSNGPLGNLESPAGLAWTQSTAGAWTVSNDAATTMTAGAIASIDTAAANHTVQADLTPSTTSSLPGVVARLDAAGNKVYARFEGNNVVSRYILNGAEGSTNAFTYNFVPATAYTFKLAVTGTTVAVSIGVAGSSLTQILSYTIPTGLTGTALGAANFGSDAITLDNFTATTP